MLRKEFNNKPKKVIAVGSLTMDDIGVHKKLSNLDAKTQAEASYFDLGGGAMNYALALRAAANAYGTPLDIQAITKKGLPAPASENATRAEKLYARTQKYVHAYIDETLEDEGIAVLDTVEAQFNSIPFNRIIEHNDGRLISMSFNHSVGEFLPEIVQKIENAAAESDLVFVHTRYPRQSMIAARAAQKAGVPVLLDYSVTKENWDNNVTFRSFYEDLLKHSTYVVASADTVVGEDMEEPHPDFLGRNADTLLERIHQYGVPHIAISDGTKPVKVLSGGEYAVITISPYKGDTYALGVGDTRNAGLSLGLIQDKSFIEAVSMGSAIASYKVRSPGRDWMDSFEPKDTKGKNEIKLKISASQVNPNLG